MANEKPKNEKPTNRIVSVLGWAMAMGALRDETGTFHLIVERHTGAPPFSTTLGPACGARPYATGQIEADPGAHETLRRPACGGCLASVAGRRATETGRQADDRRLSNLHTNYDKLTSEDRAQLDDAFRAFMRDCIERGIPLHNGDPSERAVDACAAAILAARQSPTDWVGRPTV